MKCRYPGCVLVPPEGDSDLCVVHRDPSAGKTCDFCHGSGYIRAFVVKGKTEKHPCDRCGGVGLRDAKKSTVTPKAERVAVDDRGLIQKANEPA